MAKLKPAVNDDDQQTGNKAATITLVEFGDYQCPHCSRAHPLVKRLLQEIGDKMRFVFRNFPLNEIHPVAMIAALAAEAAGKQGKFWEMHDLIFENQATLDANRLVDFALQLGLDKKQFATDWKSEPVSAKVEYDFESGVRSGVNGTPTFFLNDAILNSYDGSYQSLKKAIEEVTA